jgi:hypothetical protein
MIFVREFAQRFAALQHARQADFPLRQRASERAH